MFIFQYTHSYPQTATAEQNKLVQSLGSKDAEIFRGNKHVDKLEKEKSSLKTEIQNITVGIQHIRTELAEKEHECMSLYKSLADAEKKATRATQQSEALQKEKDSIGFELVKRNDEIRNLNEKLKLMQAALDRGGMLYFLLGQTKAHLLIALLLFR